MALAYIGPVLVDHGNPAFGFGSDSVHGVSGYATWNQAKALRELVANPDRRINAQGHVGVLEPIWFDDAYLRDFCGMYLLESMPLSPSQGNSLSSYTAPFTLAAYRLDRMSVVTHSSRQLVNDFALVGQSVVASPFWNEDAGGGQMLVTIDGTTVAREYDPTT